MSLYGVMRSSVSGMTAQGNKLSTVADNIQNVNTNGYKRASTEFSSLILRSGSGQYNSGSVETHIRYAISEQGATQFTTSATDLRVQGNGFFVVTDQSETPYLTRAGSFVPDGEGNLVNAAGFYLMGYNLSNGPPNVISNSLDGLEVVNISQTILEATPTTLTTVNANLDVNAATTAGPPAYTSKTSIITFDNVGNEVMLDVYMFKTGANAWTISAYDNAASTNGGFPYSSGPLDTDNFTFDVSATGKGRLAGASPTALTFNIPGGSAFTLDLSNITQVASDFEFEPTVNGNAPSSIEKVEIGSDGTLFAIFENGARRATYKIPLANVPSPDNLSPEAGNVFSVGLDSGNVQLGFSGESGLGTIASEALEQSNVDLAEELTAMIESQRGYTANSKVFQTGSDLLEVLVNLKR